MKLVILQVPDGPNAAVLGAGWLRCSRHAPDILLTRQIVTCQADALRLGRPQVTVIDGDWPRICPAETSPARSMCTRT